jgi:hypothetical protein
LEDDVLILYAPSLAKKAKAFGLFPNPALDVVNVNVRAFKGQSFDILIANQLGQNDNSLMMVGIP